MALYASYSEPTGPTTRISPAERRRPALSQSSAPAKGNCDKFRRDETNLIHEMIHATGLTENDHTSDPKNVFTKTRQDRENLEADHADRLAHAFFARSRTP